MSGFGLDHTFHNNQVFNQFKQMNANVANEGYAPILQFYGT